ncbi:MAG: BlaI/MecI/CopY family transcriptional regulator [Actinomycetota bacterium]
MRAFGELEERIMNVLWQRAGQPATVRDVHAALTRESQLAYTTVMTVLDRLCRKGLLARKLRGRAYEYVPVISEAEHTAGLMHELLARTGDRKSALAHFVRGIRKGDEAELLRLVDDAGRRRRNR